VSTEDCNYSTFLEEKRMNAGKAEPLSHRSAVRLWLLSFILWTVFALVQAFQSYSGEVSEGGSPRFGATLILQLFT